MVLQVGAFVNLKMEKNQKILVIDDVKNVREGVKAILMMEGFDVSDVASVDEAVSLLRQSDFDLIVTDMIMPDSDGVQVFDYLEEVGKSIPVLAMSGGGAGVSAQLALKSAENKARGMLKKPFTATEIKMAINNILG